MDHENWLELAGVYAADALDGEDILPGFACNLNVILEATA